MLVCTEGTRDGAYKFWATDVKQRVSEVSSGNPSWQIILSGDLVRRRPDSRLGTRLLVQPTGGRLSHSQRRRSNTGGHFLTRSRSLCTESSADPCCHVAEWRGRRPSSASDTATSQAHTQPDGNCFHQLTTPKFRTYTHDDCAQYTPLGAHTHMRQRRRATTDEDDNSRPLAPGSRASSRRGAGRGRDISSPGLPP